MRYPFRTVTGTPAVQPVSIGVTLNPVLPVIVPQRKIVSAPSGGAYPTAVEWLTAAQTAYACEAYFSGSFLDFAVGERWIVTADCDCVGVAYTADGNHGSMALRLWNALTGTLLATVTVPTTTTGVSTVGFAAVRLTKGMFIVTDGYVASGPGYYRHNLALTLAQYGRVQEHVIKMEHVYGAAGAMSNTSMGGHFYGVGPITTTITP